MALVECPKCETVTDTDAKYCFSCGHRMDGNPSPPACVWCGGQMEPGRHYPHAGGYTFGTLAVAGIVGGFLMVGGCAGSIQGRGQDVSGVIVAIVPSLFAIALGMALFRFAVRGGSTVVDVWRCKSCGAFFERVNDIRGT